MNQKELSDLKLYANSLHLSPQVQRLLRKACEYIEPRLKSEPTLPVKAVYVPDEMYHNLRSAMNKDGCCVIVAPLNQGEQNERTLQVP